MPALSTLLLTLPLAARHHGHPQRRCVSQDELASFLATQRGGGAAAGHVDEQMMDEHVHQHHGGLYDESYFDDIPMPDPDSDYCDE